MYLTHGHGYGEANPPKLHAGDILLTGHTHIPCHKKVNHFLYWNPGSVSIPKEASNHGYMTLSDTIVEWKTLSGEVYARLELSSLPL